MWNVSRHSTMFGNVSSLDGAMVAVVEPNPPAGSPKTRPQLMALTPITVVDWKSYQAFDSQYNTIGNDTTMTLPWTTSFD